MVVSILILSCSLVLLGYWFRYSCLLLIRSHESAQTAEIAAESRFSLRRIQDGLRNGDDLAPLHAALDRDYKVLVYLLEHASGLKVDSIEDRLLVLDYRLMQRWYRITRTLFPEGARSALSEMTSIAGILASRLGERA